MITKTQSTPPQEIIFLLFAAFGSIINSLLAMLFGLMALSAMITDGYGAFPSPIWWAFSGPFHHRFGGRFLLVFSLFADSPRSSSELRHSRRKNKLLEMPAAFPISSQYPCSYRDSCLVTRHFLWAFCP